MKLVKYKVNKFRSVKGTDWIELDELTCFVGINESGKTNLLLPLWKFNPADNETEIDNSIDYPRDEYGKPSKYDDVYACAPFIETLFKLTKEEVDDLDKKYATYTKTGDPEKGEWREEGYEINPQSLQFLLISKDYWNNFYVYSSNEDGIEGTDLRILIGEKLNDEFFQFIPKFTYINDYCNLGSEIHLTSLKKALANLEALSTKEKMKFLAQKALFDYIDLSIDELLELGRMTEGRYASEPKVAHIATTAYKKRHKLAKINSAASRLSTQLKTWWPQNDCTFLFNVNREQFEILVRNNDQTTPTELELRGSGWLWFFSLFLTFLAEGKNTHQDCILLLDEPGLSLHPSAQIDLLRFFEQLSNKNQIIYTTHLPFLIDPTRLDRVKAIYKEKGETKASNDISMMERDEKVIQPVNVALIAALSQSLDNCSDRVIVEGITDQFYLNMIKDYLVKKGKLDQKKQLSFLPVGGAKRVQPIVALIYGDNKDLPFCLLDSDEQGKEFQEKLNNGPYYEAKEKIIETDTFTEKSGSAIEDLLPPQLLVDSFNSLFESKVKLDISEIDTNEPIIQQLKVHTKDNGIEHQPWKAALSRKVKQKFKSEVDADLEAKWEKLFKTLQRQDLVEEGKDRAQKK